MKTARLLTILALGVAAAQTVPAADGWVDPSPHKVIPILRNGFSLECLDWGGRGEVVLLLAGMGNSAHIYDSLAPKLTDRFRVIGLTRRGQGASGAPGTPAQDIASLTSDILRCMEQLGIDRAAIIGHSFGAIEASVFAQSHPERVTRIVYLDGAYVPSLEQQEISKAVGKLMPSPGPNDTRTVESFAAWFRKNRPGWNDLLEADLRNIMFADPATATTRRSNSAAFPLLVRTALTTVPDFPSVAAPSLAIFGDDQAGRLRDALPADRTADREAFDRLLAFHHKAAEQFRQSVKNGRVIELADTGHYCFVQRESEVLQAVREFLLK